MNVLRVVAGLAFSTVACGGIAVVDVDGGGGAGGDAPLDPMCEGYLPTCPAQQPIPGTACSPCDVVLDCFYGSPCVSEPERYVACVDGSWSVSELGCSCTTTADCPSNQVCFVHAAGSRCAPHRCKGALDCDCMVFQCDYFATCSIIGNAQHCTDN